MDNYGKPYIRMFRPAINKFEKNARIGQWIIMTGLTYVCFVPAKGLMRVLSANSSNIAFEVSSHRGSF